MRVQCNLTEIAVCLRCILSARKPEMHPTPNFHRLNAPLSDNLTETERVWKV